MSGAGIGNESGIASVLKSVGSGAVSGGKQSDENNGGTMVEKKGRGIEIATEAGRRTDGREYGSMEGSTAGRGSNAEGMKWGFRGIGVSGIGVTSHGGDRGIIGGMR